MSGLLWLAAVTHRPPSEIARLSVHERAAWTHWLRKVQRDEETRWWERLGRHLGTLWYRGDFSSKSDGSAKDPDRSFYPLSVLISPNSIQKQIKGDFEKQTGKIEGYVPQAGEEIVEVGELDTEEYRTFMQRLNEGLGST